MGMSSGGSPTKEINVTPLIDILLVLLVIFLVTMPIIMRMETVDIPPKDVTDTVIPEPSLNITIHAELTASIDDGPALMTNDLARALGPRLASTHLVFVGFDDGVPWNEVVSTVDTVKALDAQIAIKMRD